MSISRESATQGYSQLALSLDDDAPESFLSQAPVPSSHASQSFLGVSHESPEVPNDPVSPSRRNRSLSVSNCAESPARVVPSMRLEQRPIQYSVEIQRSLGSHADSLTLSLVNEEKGSQDQLVPLSVPEDVQGAKV